MHGVAVCAVCCLCAVAVVVVVVVGRVASDGVQAEWEGIYPVPLHLVNEPIAAALCIDDESNIYRIVIDDQ